MTDENLDSKGHCFNQNDFHKSTCFTNRTFQVKRVYLNKEFYQYYNRSYRDWFFSYFSNDMQQLSKIIYYSQLVKIKENIHFFDWLNDFLPKHQISIPNYVLRCH